MSRIKSEDKLPLINTKSHDWVNPRCAEGTICGNCDENAYEKSCLEYRERSIVLIRLSPGKRYACSFRR